MFNMWWLDSFRAKNELLFWFGLINLLLAVAFFFLSRYSSVQLVGVNAWYKPIKFALSIGTLSWTMVWFTGYFPKGTDITIFNWVFMVSLGFEIIYIGIQAGRGQLSHFNVSTPFYSFLYSLMAFGATAATLAVGYIGLKFMQGNFPELPQHYLWAIRLSIVIFVVFSFEGFVMGSRMNHTIGGPDGGNGLPFLNWSRKYGDPRIAHFIGMHALQVLPLLAYYLLKDVKLIIAASTLYALLAVYVLVQAFQGIPLLKG